MNKVRAAGPLQGLRVVELGQLIAGPFAGKTLGDFGAEVIKVEPPGGGDPLRQWRLLHEGTSVWWQVQSRNKQSVVLDLRTEDGRADVRRLIDEADVLIENFKPGTLEKWGLGYEALAERNPGLVMLRISGYGQDGPYRDLPGFAVVAEAMGGLRHLMGEPGRPPVRAGVSLGDTLAALHGVIGVLLALQSRARTGRGQVVDVALFEAVFNCMESLLPEYSAFDAVRQPAGSALPGIAPSNAYRCADGQVVIGGNGDSIYKRLMAAIGRADLGEDPALAHNAGRVARVDEIDAAIGAWTAERPVDEVVARLQAASVPVGRIYTVADIAQDPHYRARGLIERIVTDQGLALDVPGVLPRLSATPGAIRRTAPALGADTEAVLAGVRGEPVRVAVAPPDFQDWAGLLALLRDSFAYMEGRIDPPSSLHALDAEGLREKARQETLVLATVGPRLLGCAYLARRPEGLYLGKLAVAEAARGRGLARRLVDVAECLARAHGLPVIELQTRVALTENLRCFAALGFTEHARTAHPGFDQPTSVTLRRPVRAA